MRAFFQLQHSLQGERGLKKSLLQFMQEPNRTLLVKTNIFSKTLNTKFSKTFTIKCYCFIVSLIICLIMFSESICLARPQGALYIISNQPDAKVYLDNEDVPQGTTPSLISNIPAGTHIIELRLPGYALLEVTIEIIADRIKDVEYNLDAQFGNLDIITLPAGAAVWLDNEKQGVSPLKLTELLACEHQVHIELKGHKPWFKQIKLTADKTERLKVELVPLHPAYNGNISKEECGADCHGVKATSGKLNIISTPINAHVWIDDKLQGQSPLELKLFPGNYTIRLSKPGYNEYQENIQILPNKASIIKAELEYKEGDADMAYIPAGDFIMGSEGTEPDESPLHKVYLDTFYIDKYEVTNAEYRKFFFYDTHRQPSYPFDPSLGGDMQPVVGISWKDAFEYCKWAGKRLPTEAEWEKAAKGKSATIYPWGDKWNTDYANNAQTGLNKTANVGTYPLAASSYGVFDMAGNVWEWCNDYYAKDYYSNSVLKNPKGPKNGRLRTLRGGSWFDDPVSLRTTARRGENPRMRLSNIGFRCAKDGDR